MNINFFGDLALPYRFQPWMGLIEGRAIKRYSEIFLGLQCFGNRWGYGGQPKTLLPGFILHLSLSSEKQIGRIIIMKSLTLPKNVYAMSLSCFHFFNVCTFIDCAYFEGRTTLTYATNYCKSVSRDSELRLGQNHNFFAWNRNVKKNDISRKKKKFL